MKKIIMMLAAFMAVSLTACSKKAETQTAQQDTIPTNKTKENKKMKVTELTAAEFKNKIMDYEKHLQEWVFVGDKPAVIDFYATWCGPCKAVAPIVEELANDLDGKVDFYKIDVDKQQELAALFGVRSIPSILLIPKDGKPQMSVGAMDKKTFSEAIDSVLLK